MIPRTVLRRAGPRLARALRIPAAMFWIGRALADLGGWFDLTAYRLHTAAERLEGRRGWQRDP